MTKMVIGMCLVLMTGCLHGIRYDNHRIEYRQMTGLGNQSWVEEVHYGNCHKHP